MRHLLTKQNLLTYDTFANRPFPRHTSYPPANLWHKAWTFEQTKEIVDAFKQDQKPLSLYIHVPYCEKLCLYCGCNRQIVPAPMKAENDPSTEFVKNLLAELDLFKQRFQLSTLDVKSVHFGGGTPTFLSPACFSELLEGLKKRVHYTPDLEMSVELDPRITTSEHISLFKKYPFKRFSLGVQDFDPEVQKAIGRIQSFDLVKDLVAALKSEIPGSKVNFDVIYGLPKQTTETMTKTLTQVNELRPDRISFFRLAYMPKLLKWQKALPAESIPSEHEALQLFCQAWETFESFGYHFVGLDHFVLENDPLYLALQQSKLRRNFQGMTQGEEIVLGLGPTAISTFPNGFFQNDDNILSWSKHISNRSFSWAKGYQFKVDDKVIGGIIESLYCYQKLSADQLKIAKLSDEQWQTLRNLEKSHLLNIDDEGLRLSEMGRLLLRVVASVFDKYFQAQEHGREIGSRV